MILEVQHETRQEYNEPVTEWHAELRLQPCNDEHQSCHSFHLIISQPATTYAYEDGFGNRVHHFNLLKPHLQVRVLSASLVETSTRDCNLAEFTGRFPLALDSAPCEMLDFLPYRGPVCDTPLLSPLLDALAPASGDSVGAWVVRVGNYIHEHFEYARDVTDFTSPIDDLLKIGKGVCQDFAHLMIAVLRSNNVPARYVSGYIHRENKESQSHAWCEAWLPGLGWIGFDPTNGCQANDHFVRVAVGRDYTDVPPNKGIHRGQAHETIFVRVATRELPRLPSMSWQERLPPLDVPLTSIAPQGDHRIGRAAIARPVRGVHAATATERRNSAASTGSSFQSLPASGSRRTPARRGRQCGRRRTAFAEGGFDPRSFLVEPLGGPKGDNGEPHHHQ